MAHDVHLHVSFSCDRNDGVAELARKHLPSVEECPEATYFLKALSERTGGNPGQKGGLSLWGIVGNYTDEDQFATILAPFWSELLSSDIDGGPLNFERIIVFAEHEQTNRATAQEIYLAKRDDPTSLAITKHTCPFTWNQY